LVAGSIEKLFCSESSATDRLKENTRRVSVGTSFWPDATLSATAVGSVLR